MFDKILGIPAHPLIIHAAVVFIPLLVAAALAYALVPRLRARIGWLAVLLAVVTPFTAWFATLSGNRLKLMLIERNYPPEIINRVNAHKDWGDKTLWSTIVLAVLAVALIFATSGSSRVPALPKWVTPVLSGAIVVFGVITAYYVFRTGDSGAHAVWSGF